MRTIYLHFDAQQRGNGDRYCFPPFPYISAGCNRFHLPPTRKNHGDRSNGFFDIHWEIILTGSCTNPPGSIVYHLSAVISHSSSLAVVYFTVYLLSNFSCSSLLFPTSIEDYDIITGVEENLNGWE